MESQNPLLSSTRRSQPTSNITTEIQSNTKKKTHKVKDKEKIKEKDITVVVIMEMAKPTIFVHRKILPTVQQHH